MVTLDGASIFVFSTQYFNGREVCYGLLKKYASQGAQHPGQCPVVALGTKMQAGKKGDFHVPTLDIVGWSGRPQIIAIGAPAEMQEPRPARTQPIVEDTIEEGAFGDASTADPLDDEIPF
jgi:hypothetical protein